MTVRQRCQRLAVEAKNCRIALVNDPDSRKEARPAKPSLRIWEMSLCGLRKIRSPRLRLTLIFFETLPRLFHLTPYLGFCVGS